MLGKRKLAGIAALTVAMAAGGTDAAETILFNSFAPPKHIINTAIVAPWFKEIEKVTEGRVKIKVPAKNLAPPPRQFDVVTQQIADGAYIFTAFLQKRVPLIQLSIHPLITTTAEANAVALWRTYKKFFEAKNQYKGVVLLGFFSGTGADIASMKGPITSVDDLKKMKVWSLPGIPGRALSSLGVTIVPGPAVRIYPIVSKGTVDAFSGLSIAEMYRFKVAQFAKSFTYLDGHVFAPSFSAFVSPAKWNKISKSDRAAIMKASGEALARRSRGWDDWARPFEAKFKNEGKKVYRASPEMMAKLRKAWAPFKGEWIATADKLGVDGKAAYAYFIEQSKKVTAERR